MLAKIGMVMVKDMVVMEGDSADVASWKGDTKDWVQDIFPACMGG